MRFLPPENPNALATLRQNFVFVTFLSKVLPSKKPEADKILNEKLGILSEILAKEANFFLFQTKTNLNVKKM